VHFDVFYLIKANLILTLLGLAMVADVSRRVEGE
jgi:capsular polysaccharide transport system permease protein